MDGSKKGVVISKWLRQGPEGVARFKSLARSTRGVVKSKRGVARTWMSGIGTKGVSSS